MATGPWRASRRANGFPRRASRISRLRRRGRPACTLSPRSRLELFLQGLCILHACPCLENTRHIRRRPYPPRRMAVLDTAPCLTTEHPYPAISSHRQLANPRLTSHNPQPTRLTPPGPSLPSLCLHTPRHKNLPAQQPIPIGMSLSSPTVSSPLGPLCDRGQRIGAAAPKETPRELLRVIRGFPRVVRPSHLRDEQDRP